MLITSFLLRRGNATLRSLSIKIACPGKTGVPLADADDATVRRIIGVDE